MSDEAHSPAPWRIVTDGISHWIEIQPNKIALIHAKKADRDLIAAAPDLLSALHGVDEFCQQGLNSPYAEHWEAALHDIMELVRASIAKAKGE